MLRKEDLRLFLAWGLNCSVLPSGQRADAVSPVVCDKASTSLGYMTSELHENMNNFDQNSFHGKKKFCLSKSLSSGDRAGASVLSLEPMAQSTGGHQRWLCHLLVRSVSFCGNWDGIPRLLILHDPESRRSSGGRWPPLNASASLPH